MKVVITSRSLERLEESLRFYLEELDLPLEKVLALKDQLIRQASSLSKNPYKGQLEPYLSKLQNGHRRVIAGNFKIIYKIQDDIVYITDFFDSRKNPTGMKA